MTGLSTDKELYKRRSFVLLAFCCVTLITLITRYASFYTFKGSDDLHYAFLSSEVLNGNYDMFFAQDIYAGRTAVVYYQALWFKLFGINDFSMCMPSLSILIILAYVVCFKCGLQKNIRTVFLASFRHQSGGDRLCAGRSLSRSETDPDSVSGSRHQVVSG